jgi:hypothetical protein
MCINEQVEKVTIPEDKLSRAKELYIILCQLTDKPFLIMLSFMVTFAVYPGIIFSTGVL